MKGAQLLFKSLAGMLFLLITMGLAIFLPYGSINYSSAWIYLAVFFTSSIWITAYLFLFDQALLEKRVKAGPVAEPSDGGAIEKLRPRAWTRSPPRLRASPRRRAEKWLDTVLHVAGRGAAWLAR